MIYSNKWQRIFHSGSFGEIKNDLNILWMLLSVYIIKMSSVATLYRKEHPEYYAQERIREKERMKLLYHTNPEYREKVSNKH